MNRKTLQGVCALLALVLTLVGCTSTQQEDKENQVEEQETAAPVLMAEAVTAEPTEAPTEEPTEAPTPEPTEAPTPVPTREPEEGDICANFPDYDTGVDADYSYQSDELRIAIKKVVDEENVMTYFVADIWMRNYRSFRTAFGSGEFCGAAEDATTISERENAILGVSGSYNQGFVLHNGVFYQSIKKKKSDNCLALYKTGELVAYRYEADGFNAKKAAENGVWQGWQFGPMFIHNGESATGYNPGGTRHPRCIIGYYEPGHYVMVLVDGRQEGYSIGMNYYECVELMESLGCVEAYNLDGGESIRMTFMGEVINHPSGDRDGDGMGDRLIVDMLVFAEYDLEGNAPAYAEVADKVRIADKAD